MSSILGLYFRIRIAKGGDVSWNLGLVGIVVYGNDKFVS